MTSSSASHGGRRHAPYAFTEQGVAMLSSVLRSPRAVEVNIHYFFFFIELRHLLSVHKELAERLMKREEHMRKTKSCRRRAISEGVCATGSAFQSAQSATQTYRLPREGRIKRVNGE